MNPAAQNVIQALSAQQLLLMKMRILSLGKNYDVMDRNQNVLCHVGLDASQNMKGALVGAAISQVAGGFVGRWAQRSLQYTYDVTDATGNLAMQIRKGSGGNKTQFLIVDPHAGGTFGTIDMRRSLIGGLKADWVLPGGQTVMSTKGNIIRRKYRMVDPSGRELGRVRHKMLAIRDVWQLELEPGANHLYSTLFATVLDFEKKM